MKENARRREEQLDRKDQKEIEQRNRMRLFDYGELEEYEKVQMLDVDPATHQPIHRRIYKIGKFEGRKNAIQRPSLHARAVECLAWDQVCNCTFLTLLIF
jgi:hypothetical protein